MARPALRMRLPARTELWVVLGAVVAPERALKVGLAGTDSALGPLKATLRKELNIDNTQYGTSSTARADRIPALIALL